MKPLDEFERLLDAHATASVDYAVAIEKQWGYGASSDELDRLEKRRDESRGACVSWVRRLLARRIGGATALAASISCVPK
jgi:uncharacterized protein (DUF2235 family)